MRSVAEHRWEVAILFAKKCNRMQQSATEWEVATKNATGWEVKWVATMKSIYVCESVLC